MLERITAWLRPIAAPWAGLKIELGLVTGLSPDALHILGGLVFLALCGLALRREPLSRVPLAALFALTALNEAVDLTLEGMGSTEATLGASLHDLVTTLAGPLLLAAAMLAEPARAKQLGRAARERAMAMLDPAALDRHERDTYDRLFAGQMPAPGV